MSGYRTGNRLLCVGTGTVGGEFARQMSRLSKASPLFKWDRMIIHKEHPYRKNVFGLKRFRELGWLISVKEEQVKEFEKIGIKPDITFEDALTGSTVIFDATPAGGENKELYYYKYSFSSNRIFIAEGSEFRKKEQFGMLYVFGKNDQEILDALKGGRRFFVVGSCNLHSLTRNILAVGNYFGMDNILQVSASILRRSDDPNKEKVNLAFKSGEIQDDYKDEGSYHAYNAKQIFLSSLGNASQAIDKIFARADTLSDPYMHVTIHEFILKIPIITETTAKMGLIDAFYKDPFLGVTNFTQTNQVYYEAGNVGPLRGSYLHSVVSLPTISITKDYMGNTRIIYEAYTPQDKNVIQGNLALACMAKDPKSFSFEEFYSATKEFLSPKEI